MEDIGLPLPWGIVPTERLLRVVIGNDPAAGQEVTVTVPGGVVWEVLSFAVDLATDATVVSRVPTLTADDGAVTYWRQGVDQVQPASTTARNVWFRNGPANGPSITAQAHSAAIIVAPLLAGHRLRTNTDSLQAADNYGAPVLYVVEYQVRGLERAFDLYERAVIAAAGGPG